MIPSERTLDPPRMNFTPLRAACCMRIAVIAWSVGISESGVEARRNDT